MNNKTKLFGVMVLFLISIVAISGIASAALPISDVKVEVEDRTVYDGSGGTVTIPGLDKDNEIEIEVSFTATADIKEVQVEAEIRSTGHRDSVSDITDGFDTHNSSNYLKKLILKLPQRMDNLRQYSLLVAITGRTSSGTEIYTATGTIDVSSKQHQLQIKDIVLSPEDGVQAGRALLATVRVKNRGDTKEEDIKVKVSIPALGISASDYIDELDAEGGDDDSATSEELYLRIPVDAITGEYTVKAEIEYDDGDEQETETATINIVGEEEAAATSTSTPKTIIVVPEQVQDVTKSGSAAVYPITITNSGSSSRTYTITADGANWADFTISPSNAVLISSGESKAVYVSVAAKSTATAGENTFAVTIKSDDTVLKEIPLKANVLEAGKAGVSLKRALEVSLVILVVLIVIIGLIIGLGKLKGKEEGEGAQEDKETYY